MELGQGGSTLDTTEDFQLLSNILEALYPSNPRFGLEDILRLIDANPELCQVNAHVQRKHV